MTDKQRRLAIEKQIDHYTTVHTSSKTAARQALIKEGIYTTKGALRAEFGGGTKKAKAAA